ncbi:MAG: DUF222 domain-containing protein [Candidatus Nanopelagicales bacterium]
MSLEISPLAMRRARIRDSLPTEHPKLAGPDGGVGRAELPDPSELSLEELAGSLGVAGRLVNQLEAWLTAVAAEADTRKASQVLCAGTTGTMVAAALNTNGPVGSGMVSTGHALAGLPHVAQAFTAGRIGTRQVLALQHAASRIENFGVHEKHLVQVAERVDPKELRRLLDVLITQSIPEHADLELDRQHSKRGVSLNERQDGMWKLDGLLDAIAGNKLNDLLQPLMAKDGADDPRGPKQRRADALDDVVSLARASRSPLGVSGLSVLVDIDTLPDGAKAALEDGRLLGPDGFDLLSCTVAMSVIFGLKRPKGFEPLQLARTAPAGLQSPMGRPESPGPRLRVLRETTPLHPSPPHHPLERRRPHRHHKPGPAVCPMPPRPTPRLLQRHHGRRRHPDPDPRPRTTRQTCGIGRCASSRTSAQIGERGRIEHDQQPT